MTAALCITALIMGAAGSIHCAGMCGPIALVVFGNEKDSKYGRILAYNGGRILLYVILGAIAGLAGRSVIWFAGQQWLSIIAGIIVLLSLCLVYVRFGFLSKLSDLILGRLRFALGKVMRNRRAGTLLYMGMLNGLLPCGLVYAALGGAAGAGSLIDGALFMALFGAATLPVLFGIAWAGSSFGPALYKRLMKLVPITVAIMGALLVIRGLGLGIPYLSPAIECGEMACCH